MNESLDPLILSTITPFIIPSSCVAWNTVSVLTNLKFISLMQSSPLNSRIIYPTASSEAPLWCSVKLLRLNIYKLNWSPPEQSSSPGNLLLLVLRLKTWGLLLPHTPCNAPGSSVSSIFKISPEPSLFLPLPLLPHPSGPPLTCIVVTVSCFYPCLWPLSYSSQTNFCKNFGQVMSLFRTFQRLSISLSAKGHYGGP